MLAIDLNCDLGEGDGPAGIERDRQLMRFISSANIACGAHAGSERTMRACIDAAIECQISIGAHPGFADPEHFGRRDLQLSIVQMCASVTEQLKRISQIAESAGTKLAHVKLHGALYHLAAKDSAVAAGLCSAIAAFDGSLILYGLSGSQQILAANAVGLRTCNEVFIDRHYLSDGTLVSRSEAGAVVVGAANAARRLLRILQTGTVEAIDGSAVHVNAETACLHSDQADSLEFARLVHAELTGHHVQIRAPRQETD